MKDKVIYYPRPFQVLFLRPDLKEPTYEQGIVYRYDIIAARDGIMWMKIMQLWKASGSLLI